jgi:hypothetical protein
MHVTKAFIAILATTSGVEAFKIRAFSGNGCTGANQEINIWDNTCRDSNILSPMRSFRLLNHGAFRQVGTFWRFNYCSNGGGVAIIFSRRVDGHTGDGKFKIGNCISMPETPMAIGSHSG